jgi:aspartate aminotransferase-like enzyme
MSDIQTGLKELFGTGQPVLPLSSSGTGAMVAAVSNLFSPGEKVLVIDGGKFAERWADISRSRGLVPVSLKVELGCGASPKAVAAALDADSDIAGVLIQHSETSTGVQHPVEDIAAVTRKRRTLLVVDGISAVSVTPCPMDAWGIDCLLTGSQKGLMLPPGLALIALSERAWSKVEAARPDAYYFNLRKERDANAAGQTSFTPAISLLIGLAESLKIFRETGLRAIYGKQWALTMMARAGVEAVGLPLFATKHFAWGVTSLLLPGGMRASEILTHAAQKYNVIMAGGFDGMKDRLLRIGHMGWLDYGDLAVGLHALVRSYTACGGHIGCRNYLEQAVDAYWQAIEQGPPVSVP